jgi:hypothetical protein
VRQSGSHLFQARLYLTLLLVLPLRKEFVAGNNLVGIGAAKDDISAGFRDCSSLGLRNPLILLVL